MISAEGPPLQRTAALIDVMDALPAALRARGHDVCVALPFYREIRENRAFKTKNTGIAVDVQVGDKVYVARYLEGQSASGVQLLLIRCDEFFDRDGIYGERGKPYEDNASRFIFVQGDARVSSPTDAAIAGSACTRLGCRAGASVCACARAAVQDRVDHSSCG